MEVVQEGRSGMGNVFTRFNGDFTDQHLLSMHQLTAGDIHLLLADAGAAEEALRNPAERGVNILPLTELKAVMRQPSTRTGGSMATAMHKLGGGTQVISGMEASSEGKGETQADSWIAFATQADIIGTRTDNVGGPATAAQVINMARRDRKLPGHIPVINLGDGTNEHPTQALGDLFTIFKKFGTFDGLTMALVGDHQRYRAHHSLTIGASLLGIKVIAVESSVAPVTEDLIRLSGDNLERTDDLDDAMQRADILYMGRNPDEYSGDNVTEWERSKQLAKDYAKWMVDRRRLQKMHKDAIVMHPRPRRHELDPSVDMDLRTSDVQQMADMIPMRMAIIARLLGKSIKEERESLAAAS